MRTELLQSIKLLVALAGAALSAFGQATVPTSSIAASPTSLSFSYRIGSTSPAAQTISLTSSPSSVGFGAFANVFTPVEGNWLDVVPNEGSTPSTLTVTVAPASLAAGTYSGEVEVSAFATNSPLRIPVTLTVLPALTVAPAALSFSYRINGPTPTAQQITASTGGIPAPVSAVVSNDPGAPWLSVTPATGTTPATFNASVNPGSLPAGTYSGAIRVSATDSANGTVDVPVTLTVLPALSVAPTSLTFTYRINGTSPAAQAFTATSDPDSPVSLSAVASTTAGGSWLAVNPVSGRTPADFSVSVAPSALSAGTYNGTVRVTATDSAGGFVDVSVTLIVLPPLTVAPSSLTFTYRINGTAPGTQTFTASSGGSPVSVSAVATTTPSGGTWLGVTPTGGTTPATFTVAVTPSALSAGTYSGTIRVTALDTANGFQDVPVTLTVLPPLNVTPTPLTFTYRINGTSPAAQTLNVSSGQSEVSVTAAASTTPAGGTWLAVNPASGTTPATFTVSVTPSSLTAGTYNGTIRITDSGGFVDVPVTLTVLPPLAVAPTSLSFTYRINGTTPGSQTFTASSGGSPVSVTAAVSTIPSGGEWLDVTPSGGTTPATFTVSVTPGGLSAGTYNGTVRVTAQDTANGFQDVPVTLTVLPPLAVAPTSLTFSYRINGTSPAAQTFTASSGGSPVTVNAVASTTPAGGTWLAVNPASGTTPATFNVSVTPGSLTAGTYNGTVRVSDSSGFVDVPVTLTVLPPLTVAPTSLTFTYRINGTSPGSQTFTASSGGSPVSVTAAASTTPAGGNWLSVAPTSGTTPATFTVSVAPNALTAGTYNATIRVTATDTANGFVDVPVTLTVLGPLSVAPTSLTFNFRINGTSPASQTFTASSQESSLAVNAVASTTPAGGTWLAVAPASGTTPATFTVSVTPGSLTAGTYSGTIQVSDAERSVIVPVTLNVLPALTVAPTSLTFTYRINGTTPGSQTFTASSGEPQVPVTAAASTTPAGGNWLSVAPASGATPATFTVSVAPSALSAGTYNGTIRVTATDTANGFVDVPVTLTVLAALSASPSAISFIHRVGGTTPPAQTLTVTNGVGATTITAVSSVITPAGGNWLSSSPGSGSTPATITVAVNPGTLEPGTYTGRVLVTGSSSSDGQFEVPVTLTVQPRISATPTELSFSHRVDLEPPAPQTITVSAGANATPVNALASTTNGGSWLNVVPASGTTPATFTVSIVPAGLTPGTYTGSINISGGDSLAGQVQVPVTLTVAGAMDPVPSPTTLSFISVNRTPPAPQQLTITRPDSEALIITAQTITPPNLPWMQISLTPPGSTGAVWTTAVSVPPGTSSVVLYSRPDPAVFATLPLGTYSGRVRITTAEVFRDAAEAEKEAARFASANNQVGERTVDVPVTLEVATGAISLSTRCPSVIPGVPFVMPVTVMGGRGTYTLTLSGPSSLGLLTATGPAGATPFVTSVSGTVQTIGEIPITITATDSAGSTAGGVSCTIASARPDPILPPVNISGASCPAADLVVGAPFSGTLLASGGTGSFEFSADNLPPGLLLTGNTITGAPNTAGTYTYTIAASSGSANPGRISCTVRVQPGPLQIRTSCPADARQFASYSHPIIASGGLGGSSYEISITGLPTGLVATRGGIGGVPTADPGSYNLTIQVRSGEQVATQSCPLTVNDPQNRPPAPQGSISCPEPVQTGSAVSIAVIARGGSGALSYSIAGPEWLRVQGGSGGATVSGTAGPPGTYPFTITVSDANGGTTQVECSLVVTPLPLALTAAECPGPVTLGQSVDVPLSVTGGTAPFRWELTSEAPGVGLGVSVGAATRITGTPTTPGDYPYTVAVIDAVGVRREVSCTLRVAATPLTIAAEGCPTAAVSRPVTINAPLTAAGGFGDYAWRLSGAPWLSLSSNAGRTVAVTGDAPAPGDYEFTATLTDTAGTPQAAFTCRFTVSAITPPTVQISGLTASIGTSESGDLQLQLAAPAPVPLTATVTLVFIPDVVLPGVTDNPLVQFTGGLQRTVTVTIPAGQQTIPLGARVVLGNIAGTVRVVLAGLLDIDRQLIGPNPPSAELRVPRQAPVIEEVTFDRTGVVIRGFSNTLDVQSVTLTFQPAADGEIEGPSTFTFSNEAQEYFRQFYQNRNVAAGSAFQVRFPITLEGDNNGIASVVVTVRNSAGETTTQAIPLR